MSNRRMRKDRKKGSKQNPEYVVPVEGAEVLPYFDRRKRVCKVLRPWSPPDKMDLPAFYSRTHWFMLRGPITITNNFGYREVGAIVPVSGNGKYRVNSVAIYMAGVNYDNIHSKSAPYVRVRLYGYEKQTAPTEQLVTFTQAFDRRYAYSATYNTGDNREVYDPVFFKTAWDFPDKNAFFRDIDDNEVMFDVGDGKTLTSLYNATVYVSVTIMDQNQHSYLTPTPRALPAQTVPPSRR